MSRWFKEAFVWRLAIVRLASYSIVVGVSTFSTAMNGLEWGVLNPTQQFITVCGVVSSIAGVVCAFLDRTISNIVSGKPPVTGDSISDNT